MGDVGWACVDEFQGFCFEHEAEEFLVWFGFKDDGLAIETFVQKDLIWREMLKPRVSKDESIVNISDVFDEEVMVGKDLFEVDGPDLLTDRNDHEAEGRGQGASHWPASALSNASLAQGKRLHVKGRSE